MEKNRIMTKKNKTTENDFCEVANRVSFITIIGNVILSVVKFLAGIIAHSNAMISDAVHSASDVFSTIVVIIGIKLASKEADKEHPYGHERLECVAAIVLAMVLFITGLGIGAEALKNIVQGNYSDLQVPGRLALIAAIVSIVSKEEMYWYTRYYAKKIDSIRKELCDYQESMLRKNKTSFLNTYIKFIEERPVTQYFEDLPLNDIRVLNSRLLKNKLDEYFNNYMSEQKPDVICQNIDNLISKASDCKEVRDYILWYLYSKYFNNDWIYIHLSDNYFSKLTISNLTENIRTEIIKRANVLRKITIGSPAPTFKYTDENSNLINLSETNGKHIVLFFYKPDCQKCIREKRILGLLKNRQKDLTILYINISEENYHNVSQDIAVQYDIKTTPTIYILDKDKRITAKNIKVEDIEFYIIKK